MKASWKTKPNRYLHKGVKMMLTLFKRLWKFLTGTQVCCWCRCDGALIFSPDPALEVIYDDNDLRMSWWCSKCYNEREQAARWIRDTQRQ